MPAAENLSVQDNIEATTEGLPSPLIVQHLNLFIVKYSQALIAFSAKAESKLMILQSRIDQIAGALTLLEKKLGNNRDLYLPSPLRHFPILEPLSEATTGTSEPLVNDVVTPGGGADEEHSATNNETLNDKEDEENAVVIKVRDVPHLQAYFKMLKMGVPAEAVKQKMARDGHQNPALLDDPEANYLQE